MRLGAKVDWGQNMPSPALRPDVRIMQEQRMSWQDDVMIILSLVAICECIDESLND